MKRSSLLGALILTAAVAVTGCGSGTPDDGGSGGNGGGAGSGGGVGGGGSGGGGSGGGGGGGSGGSCTGDPGPAVTSGNTHTADADAPADYILVFDEDVDLALADISIVLNSGTGTPGAVSLAGSGSGYTISFDDTSGWVHDDVYDLIVESTVTNVACGTELAADFVIAVTINDACAGDPGPAVISANSVTASFPGPADYILELDQEVNLSGSDLTFTVNTGTGAPGTVSVAGAGDTYAITFDDTSGWVHDDVYNLTIGVTVTNVACDAPLPAPFVIAVTAFDPCTTDDGPAVISAAAHPAWITTPVPYTLTFDEPVNITGAELTFVEAGAGTAGGVTLTGSGASYTVTFDAPGGWIDGENYILTVGIGVTNVACDTALPAAFPVTITASAADPCAGDPGATVTSSPAVTVDLSDVQPYQLGFSENVIFSAGDLTFSGAGGLSVSGGPTDYEITFDDTSAWVHDDIYDLTVNTTVTNTTCGTPMAAAFDVQVTVLDPCATDPGPVVTSPATHLADINTPANYTIVFDQEVDLQAGDLSFTVGSGTGIPGPVDLNGGPITWAVSFTNTAGWNDGDVYNLTIDAGVTNVACGAAMAADFVVAVTVDDPCASVPGPTVISPATLDVYLVGPLPYALAFDQEVDILVGDLNLTLSSGSGAPGPVGLTGAAALYDVDFDVSGWVDGDIYNLEVGASVTNTSCNVPMSAPFNVTINAIGGTITPQVCGAADYLEAELFAYDPVAPEDGEQGNTNGLLGTGTPFVVTNAEDAGTGPIDADIDQTYQFGGLYEHFDPATAVGFSKNTDTFLIGPINNVAGKRYDIDIEIDAGNSTSDWGGPNGFMSVIALTFDGFYIAGTNFDVPAGGTASAQLIVDAADLSEGEGLVIGVNGRAENAPVGLEYLDYCINFRPRLPPPFIVFHDLPRYLPAGTGARQFDVNFNEAVEGVNPTNVLIDNGATIVVDAGVDGDPNYTLTASGLTDGVLYTVSFTSGILNQQATQVALDQVDLSIEQVGIPTVGGACADSVDLSGAGSPYTETGYLNDFVDGTADGNGGLLNGCDAAAHNPYFFHYTAPADGLYSVSALLHPDANLTDLSLAAFATSCDPGTRTELDCDTAFGRGPRRVLVPMTMGETYYFVGYASVANDPLIEPTIEIMALPPIVTGTTLPLAVVSGTNSVDFDIVFDQAVNGVAIGSTVSVDNGGNLSLSSGADGDSTYGFNLSGMVDGATYTLTLTGGITNLAGLALVPNPTLLFVEQLAPGGYVPPPESDPVVDLNAEGTVNGDTVTWVGTDLPPPLVDDTPSCAADEFEYMYRYALQNDFVSAVVVDTFGSNFDTVLNVWGPPDASNVDCNDQAAGTDQSEITFPTCEATGQRYYFTVGDYFDGWPGSGFDLQINVTEQIPLVIPMDAAVNVFPNTEIVINHNGGTWDPAAGTITLTGAGAGLIATYDVATASEVVFSGADALLTVTPATDLPLAEIVTVDANLTDACGRAYVNSWSFTVAATPPAVLLNEDFYDAGLPGTEIPSSWTVLDNTAGVCEVWEDRDTHDASCGDRDFYWTAGLPTDGSYAIADSDCTGGCTPDMDTELITPSLDCSGYAWVELSYDLAFRTFAPAPLEIVDVDVWTDTAGTWTNVATYTADLVSTEVIDISAIAAGDANVQIRFHYYDATWEWFVMVDNVRVVAQ